MPGGSLQSKFVAECADTEDAAGSDVAEIIRVSKFLTRKYITQVDFDKRDVDGEQGVSNGDTRVREGARIEQNKVDASARRLLDTIDDFVLRIALEALQGMAAVRGLLRERLLDRGKVGTAVNAGLAAAKQIQVRTIDEQEIRHA